MVLLSVNTHIWMSSRRLWKTSAWSSPSWPTRTGTERRNSTMRLTQLSWLKLRSSIRTEGTNSSLGTRYIITFLTHENLLFRSLLPITFSSRSWIWPWLATQRIWIMSLYWRLTMRDSWNDPTWRLTLPRGLRTRFLSLEMEKFKSTTNVLYSAAY